MNEINKTIVFLLIATLTLGAAWWGRPKSIGVAVPDQVGQPLFPQLTEAYDAKSMKIGRYDEQVGEIHEFEVAQKDGLWVIPSHQDYPADAEDQLAAAANMLIDLTVLNVVSDKASEHALYGVVRPSSEKLRPGDKGVGKLVAIRDVNGNRLAELVVGKEVVGQSEQRYVRVGDQERVYIVKLDPDKLSTNFEDWVERDILDLNAFDIRDLTIHDYSANPTLTDRGQLALREQDRLKLTVRWNADLANWDLVSLEESAAGKLRDSQLLDNEELDADRLNAMKQALDDMQIVDVERKPPGLGAGLKASANFWEDEAGINSLFERGFYAAQTADGDTKLLSSNGEVIIHTSDGIEYTLRFGQIAGVGGGLESESKRTEATTNESEDGQSEDADRGLNRFVMVTASVDESVFEKPVLDLSTFDKPQPGDASPDPEAAEEATSQPGEVPESPDGPPAPESASETGDPQGADDPNSTAEVPAESPQDSDVGTVDAESIDVKPAVDPSDVADSQLPPSAESEDELEAARDAAIKEYERKMDAYREQLNKAREKVDKLNYRFSDWYYVVSEDLYRKIHLARSDVIRTADSTAEQGFDIDSFRQLQEEELESESD